MGRTDEPRSSMPRQSSEKDGQWNATTLKAKKEKFWNVFVPEFKVTAFRHTARRAIFSDPLPSASFAVRIPTCKNGRVRRSTSLYLPCHVPTGRFSELPSVFPAELRSAFIADLERSHTGIQSIDKHKPFRLIEAQTLLKLERTHARHLPEMPVKGRRRHICLPGEFFNVKRLCILFPQPGNCPGNTTGLRGSGMKQAEAGSRASFKQKKMNFTQDQRSQYGYS